MSMPATKSIRTRPADDGSVRTTATAPVHATHALGGELVRALPSPEALRHAIPLPAAALACVKDARGAIRRILEGDDDRLLVIAGPCSIHDVESALEYGRRLRRLQDETGDALLLVMRTYFEKPRTRLGWKGLISDPALDGQGDPARGLVRARSLLCELGSLGVPCAGELLDLTAPAYLTDGLSWAAIGARTTESQPHRELASGLPMPVGFKNPLCGDIPRMVHGAMAARAPHRIFGPDARGRFVVRDTPGNPLTHAVLRGGQSGPNADPASIRAAAEPLSKDGLRRPVIVDCSHDNSGKDPERQAALAARLLGAPDLRELGLAGLMLESHLLEGRQATTPGRAPEAGRSITDACLGWEATEALIQAAAGAVRGARRATGPEGSTRSR